MNTKSELDGNSVAPKRRARIVKKTDHVYSASQNQGERYDSIDDELSHKRASAAAAKDEKAAAIHALESEVLTPPKKNRGRPSKAYLEAQRAYEEAIARRQNEIDEAKAALSGNSKEEPDNTDYEPDNTAATEPTAPPVEQNNDDDDLPEFIKMQRDALAGSQSEDHEAPISSDDVKAALAEIRSDADETHEADGHDAETPKPAEATDNGADATATANEAHEEQAQSPKPVAAPAAREDDALMARLAGAYADGQRFIIIEDIPVVEIDDYSFMVEAPARNNVGPETPLFRRFKDDVLVSGTDAGAEPDKPTTKQPLRLGEITIEAEGVMEIDNQGVGYLRSADYNYMPSPDDVFVPQNTIRSYGLKTGDLVYCIVRVPREGEKYYALKQVISINGCAPHQVRDRIAFEHLTPLFPDQQFKLSKRGEKSPLSCRIVDLFAPIGKGQRALLVAQPKTGKTILMKQIANAIAANYPDTYLIMLLIDERPEEVTDMARTVNAEVIASTFDEPAKRHVRIANIVLEKAKRMVECGRDVVIFLDSITRLARAFNTEAPTSGKILTGGVDANALQKPKRFFGAARNIENGGSLTIIATALIDTGSKMDEVIFEEFKGTGNMELLLDRNLANKRIFPAVNLVQSSTRREDLLLDELTINRMFITRNYMADMNPIEAMNFLRKHLETTISNEEFIATIGTK